MSKQVRHMVAVTAAFAAAVIVPVFIVFFISFLNLALHHFNDASYQQWNAIGFVIWFLTPPAAIVIIIAGLPAYLVLLRLRLTQWWISVILGFIVAFAVDEKIRGMSQINFISLGFGALGAIGGFAAWLIWWLMYGREYVQPNRIKKHDAPQK